MITVTIGVILISFKEKGTVASDFVQHLRFIHAIAIIWVTMTFLLLLSNLQIIFDTFIDRLGPVDLVLFTLLLELVNLNLNVKKGQTEFWGNLQYCTALYI